MERGILFRGKILGKNEWFYGVPVPVEINSYPTKRVEMVRAHSYDELDYFHLSSEDEEVDPSTICQYIGLKDKDGVKIFEGDILEDEDHLLRFVVKYGKYPENLGGKEEHIGFYCDWIECRWLRPKCGRLFGEDKFKIIGNIYDNPELLTPGVQ